MNFNLAEKGKDGELTINIWWACLLLIFIGFLFGVGFSSGYYVIDTIINNDGFYFYYFFKEFKVLLVACLVAFVVYMFLKEKEKTK